MTASAEARDTALLAAQAAADKLATDGDGTDGDGTDPHPPTTLQEVPR